MDQHIDLLFRIENIEAELVGLEPTNAELRVNELEGLIQDLPTPLREQYEWLRSWTRYPIARLRARACTGCNAEYGTDHAYLQVSHPQLAYCEHCMRILLLRDLRVVA